MGWDQPRTVSQFAFKNEPAAPIPSPIAQAIIKRVVKLTKAELSIRARGHGRCPKGREDRPRDFAWLKTSAEMCP